MLFPSWGYRKVGFFFRIKFVYNPPLIYQIHKLYYPEVLFVNTPQSPRKEMCKNMQLISQLNETGVLIRTRTHHCLPLLSPSVIENSFFGSLKFNAEAFWTNLSSILHHKKDPFLIKLFPTEANLNETSVLQNLMAYSKKKRKFYHFLSLFLHILM